MANARQILATKGSLVYSVEPQATVVEAAQRMNEHRVGSLLVIAASKLVGIFTERDVMLRVVAAQKDPATTTVGETMTSPVACASMHTTTGEIAAVMREKRIRHLPVIDGDRVVGIISIGDINRTDHKDAEQTIQYLEQYISVT